MGPGISINYENIEFKFQTGFWKVHSALKKDTKELVSLWIADEDKLKSIDKKSDRDNYISSCFNSIQVMRKIRHPFILKITDFDDKQKTLAFASEPVIDSFSNTQTNYSAGEITNFADQIRQALSFLHHQVKLAHLNLNPSNILVTQDLSTKLFGFNFATPISGDLPDQKALIQPPFEKWIQSPIFPQIHYTAPEILIPNFLPVTPEADIFSFGAVISYLFMKAPPFSGKTSEEIIEKIQQRSISFPLQCPEAMVDTLKACLSFDICERPSSQDLQKANAFLGIETKILRYVDLFPTRTQAEKWDFFKGLSSSLPNLSQRILENKLLPIFLTELSREFKFAPILVPILIHCSEKLKKVDYFPKFWNQVSPIFCTVPPPDGCFSAISSIEAILKKFLEFFPCSDNSSLDDENNIELENRRNLYKYIWPIFQAAFNSDDFQLYIIALDKIPLLLKKMDQGFIKVDLLPKIMGLISKSSDELVLNKTIQCLTQCWKEIDPSVFIPIISPNLKFCWHSKPTSMVGNALVPLLETMNGPTNVIMKFSVPTICDILSTGLLERPLQLRLCDLLDSKLENLMKERNLSLSDIQGLPIPKIGEIVASKSVHEKKSKKTNSNISNSSPSFLSSINKTNLSNKPVSFKSFSKQNSYSAQKSTLQAQHFVPNQSQSEQLQLAEMANQNSNAYSFNSSNSLNNSTNFNNPNNYNNANSSNPNNHNNANSFNNDSSFNNANNFNDASSSNNANSFNNVQNSRPKVNTFNSFKKNVQSSSDSQNVQQTSSSFDMFSGLSMGNDL